MERKKESLPQEDKDFEKTICYILENDLMRREITIRPPKGRNAVVLQGDWVHWLAEELIRQTREWK